MSKFGNPWDSAPAESFLKALKRKLVKGEGCETRNEKRWDIFEYIELCCSRQRIHSVVGRNAPCNLGRAA